MTVGEASASMIADIGEKVVRLGWEDLYRRSREIVSGDQIVAAAQMYVPALASLVDCQAFLAACIARCRDALASAPDDAEQNARPDAASAAENGQRVKVLPGRFRMSYVQYKAAEEALGRDGKRVKYADAYRWLKQVKENQPSLAEQLELSSLMDLGTWQRYVRAGRRFYGEQANTPRHGRPHGGSIVHPDQVERQYYSDDEDDDD